MPYHLIVIATNPTGSRAVQKINNQWIHSKMNIDPIHFRKMDHGLMSTDADKQLWINPSVEYWQDPLSYASDKFINEEWSSNHSLHAPWHEAAHILHHSTPQLYGSHNNAVIRRSIDFSSPEVENLINQKISKYARTNPHEFIAEVFAKLMAGDKIDPMIMKEYNRLKGIMPKKPLGK